MLVLIMVRRASPVLRHRINILQVLLQAEPRINRLRMLLQAVLHINRQQVLLSLEIRINRLRTRLLSDLNTDHRMWCRKFLFEAIFRTASTCMKRVFRSMMPLQPPRV